MLKVTTEFPRKASQVIFAAIVIGFIMISPSSNISSPHSMFLIS